MFHSTAMVADFDAAATSLAQLFGLRVLHYGENWEPALGWRGGMTWIGDNSIELSQPIVDGTSTDKFVRRSGGGVHSVAIQVSDLDATEAHLASLGVGVAARPGDGYFFTDPRDTCGLVLQWSVLEMPSDPRWGAPLPSSTVPAAVEVLHHAFVGAVVDDPIAAAQRLASVLGTPITFIDADAPDGDAVAGVCIADCSMLLYRLDGTHSATTWGREYTRARTHVLGFDVADLGRARVALETLGVGIIRSDDHQIVVDPDATAGVPIVLVDALAPGDPRRG